ncbi:hypothetical protein AXG93_509s1270 [Marchantia polymorpha subsp. ruderalis]|uniref:Uncharacterized protein n=1 Tax=Marchantia polymorpha subsp. ruderalis TaxID=1480154 RepID=A0A176WBR6_MARPO|nr:hypothetical protein AXG93_509s1270 [Marchantia polymorpha subsp. ruderalis]
MQASKYTHWPNSAASRARSTCGERVLWPCADPNAGPQQSRSKQVQATGEGRAAAPAAAAAGGSSGSTSGGGGASSGLLGLLKGPLVAARSKSGEGEEKGRTGRSKGERGGLPVEVNRRGGGENPGLHAWEKQGEWGPRGPKGSKRREEQRGRDWARAQWQGLELEALGFFSFLARSVKVREGLSPAQATNGRIDMYSFVCPRKRNEPMERTCVPTPRLALGTDSRFPRASSKVVAENLPSRAPPFGGPPPLATTQLAKSRRCALPLSPPSAARSWLWVQQQQHQQQQRHNQQHRRVLITSYRKFIVWTTRQLRQKQAHSIISS